MTTSQQYCLRWNNHRANLLNVFEDLLHNQAFTDVTLAVDNGMTIKCHKIVLAACSMYFKKLFHELPSQQHPIIILKDVGYLEIKAILDYMYRGEVNVAQNQLSELLKIAQILKVKGLVEEHSHQSGMAYDLRREDASRDNASISPPPAISTSTGGSGNHSSPPHSTGVYSGFYGKSGISLDRVQNLTSSLSWPLSLPSHQLPTSLSSSVLSGGSYDNSIETSPLKRRKLLQSTPLINNDTPILRTVLGQAHVDSSQTMPLLQPDSHESVHYRNASSNGSATNDSDNRRSNDLAHSETAHADVSYVDEDERQTSPQSYGGDTVRNSAAADCVQPKPEWKRYKQYTRNDISSAIEAVRVGMSAVQAAKKYGVPSRTLYDKVKKLGIPTSRPFKRSASNGGSGACFPYGIGANVNGAVYDNTGSGGNANVLSENENESGSSSINVVEGLAGTSAAVFETTYAKTTKDTSQDRDSMSDAIARCSASPVIRCTKQRQQQQQQDLDDQVEDLSVSRKSDVPVIVPPSTTSAAIKDEEGLDNSCL